MISQLVTINGISYHATGNLNSWDTNFHFIDKDNNDYLVDIQDVADEMGEHSLTKAIEWAKRDNKIPYWLVR